MSKKWKILPTVLLSVVAALIVVITVCVIVQCNAIIKQCADMRWDILKNSTVLETFSITEKYRWEIQELAKKTIPLVSICGTLGFIIVCIPLTYSIIQLTKKQ